MAGTAGYQFKVTSHIPERNKKHSRIVLSPD